MIKSITVFELLQKNFPEARNNTLRAMVEHKRVRVDGKIVRSLKELCLPSAKLKVVDAAQAAADFASEEKRPQMLDQKIRLIYSDSDIAVIDKPSGVLTATDEEEKRPTSVAILDEFVARHNRRAKARLVHRLDRDASGLLVFATSDRAFTHLKKQFYDHTITRRYDAIVHGVPDRDRARLENLVFEDERGVVCLTRDIKKGKVAVLNYQVVAASRDKKFSHVRCTLETGRKHQIRVQLKAIGHAIVGDPIYGTKAARDGEERPGRLALHASFLEFTHPGTNQKVTFKSPMPRSFVGMLQQ